MTLVNLDSIGREEFARLMREAMQDGGVIASRDDWLAVDDGYRDGYRQAGDHLRASLNARLADPAGEEPAVTGDKAARGVLANLTPRD